MNVKSIRGWMRRNGVSKSELARRMGVSRTTLYSILDGSDPSLCTLRLLHEATGIDYSVLIEGVERRG